MSTSTDLVPVDMTQLPSTQVGSDDAFNELAKSGDFLGRLQLFTKGKAIDKGLIRPGRYGIPESGDEIVDLGDCVDIIPLARRPKAVDMSDKEAIIVSHDHESAEFKRIAAKSLEKDSHCMYGPSFLVFERSSGRLLEFFCGSKSTRGEAKNIYPYLPLTEADIAARELSGVEAHGPLPLTLKSRFVEKGTYSWHVPVVVKCSTPFTNLPSMTAIAREIEKFVNIEDDGVEKVSDEQAGRRAR